MVGLVAHFGEQLPQASLVFEGAVGVAVAQVVGVELHRERRAVIEREDERVVLVA